MAVRSNYPKGRQMTVYSDGFPKDGGIAIRPALEYFTCADVTGFKEQLCALCERLEVLNASPYETHRAVLRRYRRWALYQDREALHAVLVWVTQVRKLACFNANAAVL